ncbi:MAG: hypothetical protein K5657_02135 [Desulfovibrio sp.]|nr:hypothetical protein [Desulfovibrio sp.]
MSQVTKVSSSYSVFGTFSAAGSPQLAFATLQLDLAKANKEQTLTGIKEIESGQTKKKEITEA